MIRLLTLLLLLAAVSPVRAGHVVEVLETYPTGPQVTLAPGEKFYLRIAWSTDSMTRIHVRPHFQGRQVEAWTSPSPRYDQGSGETVAWFSFSGAGDRADEIRVFVGNSKSTLGATHRVSLVAGDPGTAMPVPAPAWVGALQGRVVEAAGGPQAPPTTSEERWFNGFMLAVAGLALFGLLAPAWGFLRWRGRWRIAAAVPLAGMALFVVFLLLTAAFNPGSLGLLPFVVLMAAVPSSLFMAVLLLARRITGANSKGST